MSPNAVAEARERNFSKEFNFLHVVARRIKIRQISKTGCRQTWDNKLMLIFGISVDHQEVRRTVLTCTKPLPTLPLISPQQLFSQRNLSTHRTNKIFLSTDKEAGKGKYLIKKRKKHHSENIKSEVNQISGLMEKMEIKKHFSARFHRCFTDAHSTLRRKEKKAKNFLSYLLPFTLDVHTIYDKKS